MIASDTLDGQRVIRDIADFIFEKMAIISFDMLENGISTPEGIEKFNLRRGEWFAYLKILKELGFEQGADIKPRFINERISDLIRKDKVNRSKANPI